MSSSEGGARFAVEWLGRVGYAEALELQEKRLEARRRGSASDALLLLEHPPVVTLGRSARPEHLLLSPEALAARGIELHRVARGGDVTYHGPGQLVGYLIVDLAARAGAAGAPDVTAFLRRIESVLIAALAELDVAAYRRVGWTGVFASPSPGPPRKIASIGIGMRGWVTWHGFALNASLDPADFDVIVPCGLREVVMTSVARELGAAPGRALDQRVRQVVSRAFERDLAGANSLR